MVLRQETMQEIPEQQTIPSCCHHWIIEPANGPISRGVCRNCLASKEFKNSIVDPDRDFHESKPASRADFSGKEAAAEE